LLLMWTGSLEPRPGGSSGWLRVLGTAVPAAGCLLLLAIQVPLSLHAWHMRKNEWAYYAKMASDIDAFAMQPTPTSQCKAHRPACDGALTKRRELALLLSEQRLNIYSPRVQRWHKYLPALSPVSLRAGASVLGMAKAVDFSAAPR